MKEKIIRTFKEIFKNKIFQVITLREKVNPTEEIITYCENNGIDLEKNATILFDGGSMNIFWRDSKEFPSFVFWFQSRKKEIWDYVVFDCPCNDFDYFLLRIELELPQIINIETGEILTSDMFNWRVKYV